MKTYPNKHRQIYNREVAAFVGLNQFEQHHPNVIRCFGTFMESDDTGAPTYNLLLEYADYDMIEYFADTSAPTKPEETNILWKQLLGVAEGLRSFHTGLVKGKDLSHVGFHFDLKPENILVSNKHWNIADGTFKIGDLGFSKFVDTKDNEPPMQLMDGGTPMYSMWDCSATCKI
jgi:serine/threonine protein kinase